MSEFPIGYERIPPASWAYLSSLLMLGLYFKFNRLWSVRNFDLILIMLLAPGLLFVHNGAMKLDAAVAQAKVIRGQLKVDEKEDSIESSKLRSETPAANPIVPNGSDSVAREVEGGTQGTASKAIAESESEKPIEMTPEMLELFEIPFALEKQARRTQMAGYIWLFTVGLILLVRMLVDPLMVRRPLLEPNLTPGGLNFIGASLLFFLTMNLVSGDASWRDIYAQVPVESIQEMANDPVTSDPTKPGLKLLYGVPIVSTIVNTETRLPHDPRQPLSGTSVLITKLLISLSQTAIVLGLIWIGYRHFDNYRIGIGIATLYLMLPYTAHMMGRLSHVLPAALLVWAVALYRKPTYSGLFLGLASGAIYFPIYLLPLWISFYWRRGLTRFLCGWCAAVVGVAVMSAFFVESAGEWLTEIQAMFGVWLPKTKDLQGIWALDWKPIFRLPILTGFIVVSLTMVLWPTQKNLGTLLSCSCTIMLGCQFWMGYGGGLFMAWFLPLALLTVFRPNLEDRVATAVLDEGWFPHRGAGNASRTAA